MTNSERNQQVMDTILEEIRLLRDRVLALEEKLESLPAATNK